MLFVVAVWGSTFVLIKGALVDATPAAFNLLRMTLAFAVLAAAYHNSWRGIRLWQIAAGAVAGLCLAIGYQFQTTGLARTTFSIAAAASRSNPPSKIERREKNRCSCGSSRS